MAGFYGADVAQLRNLARVFEQASTDIEQAKSLVSRGVETSFWVGPVAVRFRSNWRNQHTVALGNACGLLTDAVRSLGANADEQETASSNSSAMGAVGSIGGSSWAEYSSSLAKMAVSAAAVAAVLKETVSFGMKVPGAFKAGKTLSQLSQALRAGGSSATARAAAVARFSQQMAHNRSLTGHGSFLGPGGWLAGKFPNSAAASRIFAGLGRAAPVVGGLAGGIGVVTGINDMLNPAHTGTFGAIDRVAGGLTVISGAGSIALALGAGAALGPVGVGVVVGAGLVAGAWHLGVAVWENRENIGKFFGNVADGYVAAWNMAGDVAGDVASKAVDVVGDVADKVGDVAGDVADKIGDGAKKVGNWVKGIF